MSDFPESTEMQKQVSNIMNQGMELVDLFVNKNYLIDVDKCDPIPLSEADKTFSAMSLFQIDKIVYDLNENINDKLVSVYSALSNFGSSAILVIVSDEAGVKFYLGTRDMNDPVVAREILKKSLHGNFPGINIKEQDASNIEAILESKIPTEYSHMAITSVSIVPGMRDYHYTPICKGNKLSYYWSNGLVVQSESQIETIIKREFKKGKSEVRIRISGGINIDGSKYWTDKLPQIMSSAGIYKAFKYMWNEHARCLIIYLN